jgi:uncharacterized protein (DUF2126 family)
MGAAQFTIDESTAMALKMPVVIEGYAPPSDGRLEKLYNQCLPASEGAMGWSSCSLSG